MLYEKMASVVVGGFVYERCFCVEASIDDLHDLA
jgi:hypothetical protein